MFLILQHNWRALIVSKGLGCSSYLQCLEELNICKLRLKSLSSTLLALATQGLVENPDVEQRAKKRLHWSTSQHDNSIAAILHDVCSDSSQLRVWEFGAIACSLQKISQTMESNIRRPWSF